jgi:phospholipid/cholesterol/gamma-HCH transport system substrate-binding protein
METEKYYFRVGVFFLAAAALFVYYLMSFGSGRERENLVRYHIYFDSSIAGLARGAPIKLKGFDVGIVSDIRFLSPESDRILVSADIIATAPVREDTVASVSFQGITGTTYLALENDGNGAPAALLTQTSGKEYPVIKSRESELQEILTAAPQVMGNLAKTSDRLQKLLSDKNIAGVQEVISGAHDVLAEATGALREIRMLARTVREDPSIIIRGSKYEGYKVQP